MEMETKVIVINGVAGSGKSTFVSLCQKANSLVRELSTVDKVKEIALAFGWDGQKNVKGRRLLADIKDAIDNYDKLSLKYVSDEIDKNPGLIYFVNAREPEDVEYFVNKYKAIVIMVKNNRANPVISNRADSRVYDCTYDYIIDNNGDLECLAEAADYFVNDIIYNEEANKN